MHRDAIPGSRYEWRDGYAFEQYPGPHSSDECPGVSRFQRRHVYGSGGECFFRADRRGDCGVERQFSDSLVELVVFDRNNTKFSFVLFDQSECGRNIDMYGGLIPSSRPWWRERNTFEQYTVG